MSDPQQIERDLRDYLDKEPNLSKTDKLSYLKTIFNKHLEVDKLSHTVNYQDFFILLAEAKKHFINMKVPVFISKKILDPSELTHIAIIESFLMYLNRKDLVKKNIKLDYTEQS